MRRIPAFVSAAVGASVLAAALAGCAGPSADVTACTPTIGSGDASELVSARGSIGQKPRVDLPTPLVSDSTQRTVLEEGEGVVAQKGMAVDFDVIVFDAATGAELVSVGFDDPQGVRYRAGVPTATTNTVSTLADALVCAQEGQRFALVSTILDSRLSFTHLGLSDDDTVVFVVDVQGVFPGKADGVNQVPPDGLPVVVTAPDGTPGITVPDGEAPDATRIAAIKKGGGEAVAEGDRVVANVAVWRWPVATATPASVYTTWESVPSTLTVVEDATGQEGVVPALFQALVGSTVGSQLLIVAVPADTYGDGEWPSATAPGDTLIYVIDVLGIQSRSDDAE